MHYSCLKFLKSRFRNTEKYIIHNTDTHICIRMTYIFVYSARERFKDLIRFLTIYIYIPIYCTLNSEWRVGILILDPRHIFDDIYLYMSIQNYVNSVFIPPIDDEYIQIKYNIGIGIILYFIAYVYFLYLEHRSRSFR